MKRLLSFLLFVLLPFVSVAATATDFRKVLVQAIAEEDAAKQVDLNVPLVVRLEGTNVELGRAALQQSGLPIITASNLDDAAAKAVEASVKALAKK